MSGSVPGGWSLAIDFGTSNTAAAYAWRTSDGTAVVQPIALESDSTTMPSAVVAVSDGFVAGKAALNRARVRPEAFVREPKRWVDAGSVPLGDRDVPVAQLIAAVFTRVRAKALDVAGGTEPAALWLTHPQAWAQPQRQVLIDAATIAGFDPATIRLISEPVAAAHFYTVESPAAGTRAAVFDFGGGTCDVSVLETRDDGTFRFLHSVGDNNLGGRDFDARLRDWALSQLRQDGEVAIVAGLDTPGAAQLTMQDSVRAAKEELSTLTSSFIAVSAGGSERELSVTRDEYQGLIRGHVHAAIELVRSALHGAGVSEADVDVVYLTGGSSRTPAVIEALAAQFDKPLTRLHDPKLVVAEGALHAPSVEETSTGHERVPLPAVPDPQPPIPEPLPAVVAGWYPDTSDPARLRYWDGDAWTEHIRASVPESPILAAEAPIPAPQTPEADPQPSVAAGWYPDTSDPARLRYWDGSTWTGHTHPTVPDQAQQRQRRPWYKGPLVLLPIALVALVVLGLVATFSAMLNAPETGITTEPPIADPPSAPPSDPPTTGTDTLCWDGNRVPSGSSCAPLEGQAALEWAFPADEDAAFDRCFEVDPLKGGELERVLCTWNDLPDTTAVLSRYADAKAVTTSGNNLANDGGTPLDSTELAGRSWTTTLPDYTVTMYAYDQIPFAVEIGTSSSAAQGEHDTATGRVYMRYATVIQDVLDSTR